MKLLASAMIASALSILVTGQAVAQPAPAPAASEPGAPSRSMTSGEVRKVDTAAQKLTLKHGDIKNLGMPGMTMVFKVSDPKLLAGVKEGDKVRFTAERVDGALTVTSIEKAGP